MAILKTFVDVADFDQYDAFLSDSFVDFGRVDSGHVWNNEESLVGSWAEPVGNSLWIHMRYTQSSSSVNWDDFGIFTFEDANGTDVLRYDVFDNEWQWVLFADTTEVVRWRQQSPNVPIHWDINVVKNGTTDFTMFVYMSGNFMGSVTSANAGDRGLPVNFATFNTDNNSQGTVYMSEMLIADEDTRGWRIRQHNIKSHGQISDWTGSALGMINRRADWGIYSNTADQRASFGIARVEDYPVGAIIDRVWSQTKAQRGATGLTRFNPFFRWEDNTIVDGADQLLTEDLRTYSEEFTVSPDTTNRWTSAEMQGLQSGVRART